MKKRLSADEFVKGLLLRDLSVLSKALSLTESILESDEKLLNEILGKINSHTGKSKRIAISGLPGAGKSTVINTIGEKFISDGKRVAVLAVDPSSPAFKGSILGDKIRMGDLTRNPEAYVRPAASGNTLGGLAGRTREAILLCEAAGFDIIILETVGIGQSEATARHLVDLFVLVLLTGAGDEIQAIKRGAMELADIVLVNKAEGDNLQKALALKSELEISIHQIEKQSAVPEFPQVLTASMYDNISVDKLFDTIKSYFDGLGKKGLEILRKKQLMHSYKEHLRWKIVNTMEKKVEELALKEDLENQIKSGTISIYDATEKVLAELLKNRDKS